MRDDVVTSLKSLYAVDETPLKALLRRFTYRPGWKFTVEGGTLNVEADVVDANDQSRVSPLHYRKHLPPAAAMFEAFDWQRWLFDVVREVEMHEAAEFFQVDGLKPFDPHA